MLRRARKAAGGMVFHRTNGGNDRREILADGADGGTGTGVHVPQAGSAKKEQEGRVMGRRRVMGRIPFEFLHPL